MARLKKKTKDLVFPLRLAPDVYESVKRAAEQQEDSMNALIARVVRREYVCSGKVESEQRQPA